MEVAGLAEVQVLPIVEEIPKDRADESGLGLLQVNVVVPQTVVPGATISISVSVGGVPSQSGVTIAVQ